MLTGDLLELRQSDCRSLAAEPGRPPHAIFGLSGGGNRQICITDNGVVASYHWPSSPSGGAYTDLQLRSYTNHPDNTSFQPPAPPSNATQ